MKHSRDYIVRNDSLKGIRRVLGFCIRNLPFSQALGFLPSRDPLMPVSCGRTEATLPLSIIQRIVAEAPADRSEEHTSELQSLMRISYAVFCLKKKKNRNQNDTEQI